MNGQSPNDPDYGHNSLSHGSSAKRRKIDDGERVEAELSVPVPREYVLTRRGPGGSALSYIPGYYAFETARRIFGHDGWSSSSTFTQHFASLFSRPIFTEFAKDSRMLIRFFSKMGTET